MKELGKGIRSSGKFTGLSIGQQFANAVIHFLSEHKQATKLVAGGIALPIDELTWGEVLEIEYGGAGQSLRSYCNYYNGGQHGMGYDKDGKVDFGTGNRTKFACRGQTVAKTDKAVHPGQQSKLEAMRVIQMVRRRLAEIPRNGQSFTGVNRRGAVESNLKRQWKRAENSGQFDPDDNRDARRRTLAAIVQRYGREQFRAALLEAYGGCCAVTQCNASEALEAAHIKAYKGDQTDYICNGLLLRGDIHTLFDLNLLGIDPDSMRVALAPSLSGTTYAKYASRKLCEPRCSELRPNRQALKQKWLEFQRVAD